jgi:hypothetical protein
VLNLLRAESPISYGLITFHHSSHHSDWLLAGWPEFDPREGRHFSPRHRRARPALGSTQLPTQWVPGLFRRELNQLEREADHSPPSSAAVNAWSCTPTYMSSWRGALLCSNKNNNKTQRWNPYRNTRSFHIVLCSFAFWMLLADIKVPHASVTVSIDRISVAVDRRRCENIRPCEVWG